METQNPVYDSSNSRLEGKRRETLPAVRVDNRVIWVNPQIESPFKIEEGEATDLGLFFTPDPKGEKFVSIEVMREHNRSGILGRTVFEDTQGRMYRDIDLKGIGFVEIVSDTEAMAVRQPERREGEQTRGIADRGYVQNDWNMTEAFLDEGIRTYRIIAITLLREIINQEGERITIGDAKRNRLIQEDDIPVIEIRAFGIRTRIGDLTQASAQERKALIDDAMNLVAQEHALNYEDFSEHDYFDWFIETMSVNVARMHHNNWVHGYLSDHNITLDARVVDLDSVETIESINQKKARGEPSVKSFDNDVASLEVMLSFLKGVLGLGKEVVRPDEPMDDSNFLYIDEGVKEKIWKVYREERVRLKAQSPEL